MQALLARSPHSSSTEGGKPCEGHATWQQHHQSEQQEQVEHRRPDQVGAVHRLQTSRKGSHPFGSGMTGARTVNRPTDTSCQEIDWRVWLGAWASRRARVWIDARGGKHPMFLAECAEGEERLFGGSNALERSLRWPFHPQTCKFRFSRRRAVGMVRWRRLELSNGHSEEMLERRRLREMAGGCRVKGRKGRRSKCRRSSSCCSGEMKGWNGQVVGDAALGPLSGGPCLTAKLKVGKRKNSNGSIIVIIVITDFTPQPPISVRSRVLRELAALCCQVRSADSVNACGPASFL